MTRKMRITQKLQGLGAAWSVRNDKYLSPDDPLGSAATYHIHPNAEYPHVRNVVRLTSLRAIEEWIGARRRAAAATDDEAMGIMLDLEYNGL